MGKVSKERGDFTMACHRLHNLGFNCTGFGLGYPYILENFYTYFRVTWTPNLYDFSHFFELKKKNKQTKKKKKKKKKHVEEMEINRWILCCLLRLQEVMDYIKRS